MRTTNRLAARAGLATLATVTAVVAGTLSLTSGTAAATVHATVHAASATDHYPGSGDPTWAPTPEPTPTPSPSPEPVPTVPVSQAGTIGVATANMRKELSVPVVAQQAAKLVSRPDVDIVAWQEANRFSQPLSELRALGFETFQDRKHGNSAEDAISWRASKFTFVDAESVQMHPGMPRWRAAHPFPPRYVEVVRLRHIATGQLVAVMNTHVNQHIEVNGHPRHNVNAVRARIHLAKLRQMITSSTERWVFVTGDFNYDFSADRRVRARGFISRTIAPVAQSNWAALGVRGGTHDNRTIDYVFRARQDRSTLVSEQVLNGYRSDHRPVIVRARLH